MKVSRRQLAALAATPLVAQTMLAQTVLAQTPASPTDLAKGARDANQRNSETLAKFEVPVSTEPAFRFQP